MLIARLSHTHSVSKAMFQIYWVRLGSRKGLCRNCWQCWSSF